MDMKKAVIYRMRELIRQIDITVNEAAKRFGIPPSTLKNASFKRYEFEIAKNIWDNIKLISGRKGLTASNAVLGAFSEIIKKWSSNEEFVLSITLMDRQDKQQKFCWKTVKK